jgi:hypothetical protein
VPVVNKSFRIVKLIKTIIKIPHTFITFEVKYNVLVFGSSSVPVIVYL